MLLKKIKKGLAIVIVGFMAMGIIPSGIFSNISGVEVKQVQAASYPSVSLNVKEASVGETVPLVFFYSPAYNDEELDVVIYDSNGKALLSSEKIFNNKYSSGIQYHTVNWDTKGYSAGKYTVEVTKKFYSYLAWHEAPTKDKYSFTLVDDLNNGAQKNDYTGTDEYCSVPQNVMQVVESNNICSAKSAWNKTIAEAYNIQLTEMYMGNKANKMAIIENSFNYTAGVGENILIMKFSITNKRATSLKPSNIVYSGSLYKYTGGKTSVLETITFGDNKKDMFEEIGAGETEDRWLGVVIPKSQGMPFIKLYNTNMYLDTNPNNAVNHRISHAFGVNAEKCFLCGENNPNYQKKIEPASTVEPTESVNDNFTQAPVQTESVKTIKLSSVKCVKNTTRITGKVSVKGVSVKIKIGKKAYKTATVKGRRFTLKTSKLKRKIKITIKVSKRGYKTCKKEYKVK